MNRRSLLRSTTALLATTMLCPVKTLSHNAVLVSARRAQSSILATQMMKFTQGRIRTFAWDEGSARYSEVLPDA